MAAHKTHLTVWDGCRMTKLQGAMLVEHLDRDLPLPWKVAETRTARGLVARAWLRQTGNGTTTLTDRGRRAALKAAAAIADLSSSPSIVPQHHSEKEHA